MIFIVFRPLFCWAVCSCAGIVCLVYSHTPHHYLCVTSYLNLSHCNWQLHSSTELQSDVGFILHDCLTLCRLFMFDVTLFICLLSSYQPRCTCSRSAVHPQTARQVFPYWAVGPERRANQVRWLLRQLLQILPYHVLERSSERHLGLITNYWLCGSRLSIKLKFKIVIITAGTLAVRFSIILWQANCLQCNVVLLIYLVWQVNVICYLEVTRIAHIFAVFTGISFSYNVRTTYLKGLCPVQMKL